MILGILAGFILVILNPLTQIRKGQDSQRQHDLKQVQTAFDSYYNDNNYYPQSLLTLISTKTIQTLPKDPIVSSGWPNYGYVEDQNSNPQWNVLFAKLAFPSNSSFSCPLAEMNSCLPQNYANKGYNYCIVSGNVDCTQIVGLPVVPLPIVVAPIETPTPNQTLTPSPTIPPQFYCYCANAIYWRDVTKDISHQCQVVQTNSDPNVNYDRSCNSACDRPCTP